jgi:lipopolysaccharide transport system ATP-binding protein
MSDIAIRVEGLGKRYRIGTSRARYGTLRDSLTETFTAPFRRFRRNNNGHSDNSQSAIRSSQSDHIWALRDVSFEVKRGEVIGIIGRNGAGKSTLLKVLSRITEPTTGSVDIYGRVGSLLEVGTGFHPELTGRENIYLNGAILGMKKTEIEKRFDEIVSFAEVEQFIDTPVKYYSSGMYLRLAFAVAAHLEPEILIVDEVLAVGDAQFQKKCLGKIGDVAKAGRTVLFVSHNMGAITRFCQRAIWLDEGKVVIDSLSNEVVNRYHAQSLSVRPVWKRPATAEADGEFAFLSIAVKDRDKEQGLFNGDDPIFVEINYLVRRALAGCQIGTRIYTSEGIVIFTTSDADTFGASALPKEPGTYTSSFEIPPNLLAPGTYYLFAAAHLPNRSVYEVIDQAVVFEISPSGSLGSLDGRLGIITPLIQWETRVSSIEFS